MLTGLFAFHGTCALDQVSVQQQLFGNGGFTGVRVRNNREGAALGHLVLQAHGASDSDRGFRGREYNSLASPYQALSATLSDDAGALQLALTN